MRLEKVTLSTLAGGAAEELFQRELRRVIENIADPNYETKKGRKITLDVVILPTSANRDRAEVHVAAKAALVTGRPSEKATIFFGEEDGELVVREFDPEQMTIGDVLTDEEVDKTTGPTHAVQPPPAAEETG